MINYIIQINSLKIGGSIISFITYPPLLYFGKDIAKRSMPDLVLANFLLENAFVQVVLYIYNDLK